MSIAMEIAKSRDSGGAGEKVFDFKEQRCHRLCQDGRRWIGWPARKREYRGMTILRRSAATKRIGDARSIG